MSTNATNKLESDFNDGQLELQAVMEILASKANTYGDRGHILRVVVIILGVVAATRDIIVRLIDKSSSFLGISTDKWIIIFYTVAGASIAAIAALEVHFKYESRAAELNVLAANTRSVRRLSKTQWNTEVDLAEPQQRLEAAKKVLTRQNEELDKILEKAARLGVNITRQMLKRMRREQELREKQQATDAA